MKKKKRDEKNKKREGGRERKEEKRKVHWIESYKSILSSMSFLMAFNCQEEEERQGEEKEKTKTDSLVTSRKWKVSD